jgi:hypothetical protein
MSSSPRFRRKSIGKRLASLYAASVQPGGGCSVAASTGGTVTPPLPPVPAPSFSRFWYTVFDSPESVLLADRPLCPGASAFLGGGPLVRVGNRSASFKPSAPHTASMLPPAWQ